MLKYSKVNNLILGVVNMFNIHNVNLSKYDHLSDDDINNNIFDLKLQNKTLLADKWKYLDMNKKSIVDVIEKEMHNNEIEIMKLSVVLENR
jgi:hypothetical protein